MSRLDVFRPLVAALRGGQFKPTIILLASSLLMVSWKYLGSPECYLKHLSPRLALWSDPVAAAAMYSFSMSLFLLGVVPALIVKLAFRESLADYGVQLGYRMRTVRTFLLCAPVVVFAAYLASGDPAVAARYPINESVRNWPRASVFGLHACTYIVFYLGWEFHFRGFLQFGLRESMGEANALLVQVLASTLLHIGTPTSEVYSAIIAGILWGLLAFRTRSLLSGFLQHCLLGITLDWFIVYCG